MRGIEGLSINDINHELQKGGKFVVYQYCISIIFVTFTRTSQIFFIRDGESAVAKGLPYSLVAFLCGWWGIPWGPIRTISSFIKNFGGGIDVTGDVINSFNQSGHTI